jgi:hypothetical protein
MHKIKLVNKERFNNFIGLVSLTVLVVIALNNQTKSPIEKWHDAIENGQTWVEYVGGEMNVD